MDPRQPLSRTSSNLQQSPYSQNMAASPYATMPYGNQSNTHLPPINYPNSNLPPANQGYMQQPYRNDIPRYTAPSPVQTPDGRYSGQITPNTPMSSLPPSSVLPQPQGHNQQQPPPPPQQQQPPPPQQQQQQQPQSYGSQPGSRSSYPQPLAPAPPRSSLDPFANSPYGPPGDARQPAWSGAESMPGMTAGDVGRDPTRTHVVGSQGRRGILPSAPGRPPVMANGLNGTNKGNAIPQKDADGKFPCPNCTKTYLHAKHLKRHMLRHTGDRPYMCVLCNDTFSRSDILKRHFQKCSVRRGNPTGASHLSNPAAHLKKSQAAAAKAAAAANSPANATTPTSTSAMSSGGYPATSMPSSLPTTSASLPAVGTMPYAMANGQSEMQRPPQPPMQGDGASNIDPNASNTWPMHSRTNQMMYGSNTQSPGHFGMGSGEHDSKPDVLAGAHHVGDQWNQMSSFGGNEQYMNQMFPNYGQDQGDVKKEYGPHDGGSNGYYMPPTSLGADGTLRPRPEQTIDPSLSRPS